MSSVNAGWLFYKKMYNDLYVATGTRPEILDENHIGQINSEILNAKYVPTLHAESKNNFLLTTIYPGLVIGVGYNHNAKDCAENFDFGFFFDHTSGMPLIPGSSVKGVIRSLFKKLEDPNQREAVLSFFKVIFKENNIAISLADNSDEAINQLQKIEKHIFDGVDDAGKQVDLYSRDKFMDAIVIQGQDDSELIFADDYITPHAEDGLSEPDPNYMLKVRPGVTFKFNFELGDSIINNSLHLLEPQKLSLFQSILEFNGIGAKTNVGYGQFELLEEKVTEEKSGSQPAVAVEKTFVTIKNEVQTAKNAKSIKNKIKKETFGKEEIIELLEIVVTKITEEKSFDPTWFGDAVSEWMSSESLSNKERKNLIGNDYFDILKTLLK